MLLRGGLLIELDPPRAAAADLRIEDDSIALRAPTIEPRPGERVIDLGGAPVLPGLVNAHTHLYSALARGMPAPARTPRTFSQILKHVWWRLDRALDEDGVYLSGIAGAMEALVSGTTLVVDHHASPSVIPGSLDALKRATEEVGLRSVLCYEVTDRNGARGRRQGILENRRFLAAPATPLTRGLIGAHASFTLSERALKQLAALVEESGASLHIHLAEDRVDVEDCRRRYRMGLVERLAHHGLLRPRTLLAHGVRLTFAELERAQEAGGWLLHNPRSNMNNGVGHAQTAVFKRAALGTDGLDGDMFAEARAAYLRMRDAGRLDAMEAAMTLLAGGHRLAAALFGRPFGKLDAGGPADLVVLDYPSPTPLDSSNVAGHLLFGVDRSHVRSVMVAGQWVVQERQILTVDVPRTLARARETARGLWKRMERL
jgi:putative selenium metabolism protein SsnA